MLRKIKNKLNTTEGKTLLENFISLSALQIVGMILPLATLPYIIRTVGVSNYGIVVLAGALINYFTSVTDYSFKITATRDVATSRDSLRRLSLIYSKVISIKTILFVFSILIITLTVFLYPPFYKEKTVFFLTMPMLFGYAIFPEWFFQGIERMKYITYLNIGVKVFFTICVFVFIRHKEDYWIYPLLQSLGFIGSGVAAQFILIKKYKLRFYWLSRKTLINTFKLNFPIFVNQFLPTLYNNTSTFLLGIFTSTALVGTYDAIKKIIDLFILLISVISRVCFPYLNRKKDSFGFYKKGMLVVGIVLSLIPIIFSKVILWYLNIHHEMAAYILTVLSCGIFFMCLYDIYGINYFVIRRKDRLVMINTLLASIVGFVIAFPLILYFSILGAAINLTLSRGFMGVGLYLKFKQEEKN